MNDIVQSTFFIVDKTVQEVLHDLYAQVSGVPLYKYITKKDAIILCSNREKEDIKQDLYCIIYEMLTHTDPNNIANLKFNCRFTFLLAVSNYVRKVTHHYKNENQGWSIPEYPSLDQQLYYKEIKNLILFSCNNKIPIIYRYVIYLYYYKELNFKQISKLLSKDVKTIKSYFDQGHEIYKKIL